ncbi:MAG TPA: hypothetical protein DCR40_03070 [Prolixibacteraceae bacterium]|nr:hypothetical protein [Prolixibacteraceae bacterium]
MIPLSLKKYVLLIVPLSYIFLGSYSHQLIGLYSLRAGDPEFIYFISGLSLANGKFMLGHIDNPGTPLQYLAAFVFKGVYALRSHHAPFNHDVLANPDMYLHVLNLILTTVVAIFMYFAGKILLRISNNLTYSVLLQLSPLFTSIIFLNVGRVVPENLMPVPVMLLSLLLLYLYYRPEDGQDRKHSIWFGLISAFGLSIKLTYFPLWIIPLIVIKSWKNKLIYSGTAIVSFFVMALPVTLQISFFWGWIKGLFIHSGQYGQGESNIINWKTFGPNFGNLWNENHLFFWVMIVLLVVFTAIFLFKKTRETNLIQRIALAILSAAVIQVFILCKHYESRYFVPALMLIPVSLMLIAEFASQVNPVISRFKIPQIVLILVLSVYFVKQAPIIHSLSADLDQKKTERMKALHYMNTIEKDAIKFTVTTDYGAPLPEYDLMHSFGWSGRQKELFKPVLAELYPNSYIYFPWDNSMHFWANEPDYSQASRPAYIYFLNDNLKDQFFKDAAKYFPEKYELTRTFFNEVTQEAVYKLVKVSFE